MSEPDREIEYRDLLLPEHMAVLERSAQEKVGVPVFFTDLDLVELFTLSASSILDKSKPMEEMSADDIAAAPLDEQIQNAMTDPGKTVSAHVYENGLTTAFSILGYASSLGRRIDCAVRAVDEHGAVDRSVPGFSGHLDPAFFSAFSKDPIGGAKMLFQNLHDSVGQPQRIMVIGFISPGIKPN